MKAVSSSSGYVAGSAARRADGNRPRIMRLGLVSMIPLQLGAFLVATAHGVPGWVAAVVCIACAVVVFGLMVTWPKHASAGYARVALAVAVVSLWPAIVWPIWLFFGVCIGGMVPYTLAFARWLYRHAAGTDELVASFTPEQFAALPSAVAAVEKRKHIKRIGRRRG